MISLKQIRILKEKVEKAIDLIALLKEENRALKSTLDHAQKRIRDFETLVSEFKNDQAEIESTVLGVIKKLDSLEDEIATKEQPPSGKKADADIKKDNGEDRTDEYAENVEEEQSETVDTSPSDQNDEKGELDIF